MKRHRRSRFVPSAQAAKDWHAISLGMAKHQLRSNNRLGAALSNSFHKRIIGLPGGAVWDAAWTGLLSVHWAFWALFVSPLLLLSLLAVVVRSPFMLGMIDMVTILWVIFSFVLVWRSGYIHSGWAFTPNLYRVAMSIYGAPLLVIILGVLFGG